MSNLGNRYSFNAVIKDNSYKKSFDDNKVSIASQCLDIENSKVFAGLQ